MAVLAAALLAAGCGGEAAGGDPGAALRPLPALDVVDGRLVDEAGREWQLRGINARVEGLFDVTFDDGRLPLEAIPAFGPEDAREMVAAGFSFLRLPINWSGLEPQEGAFSDAYLARLDEVLEQCRAAGLPVLVDFHQDAWSKEIGEDGAPLWAIVPPPTELLGGPLEDLDARRVSEQVLNAFQGFFENREGIRDRFLPAWTLVVTRYAGHPAVIGFEPMNEPVLFHFDPDESLLHAFYLEVAAALRAVDADTPLWLEPDSFRNFRLSAPLLAAPFPDPKVVYCPHMYPFNKSADTVEGWKALLAESVEAMRAEAASWGAALVVGEWGANPRSAASEAYITAMQEMVEDVGGGQAFWLWKENSQGSWGFFRWEGAGEDDPAGAWVRDDEALRRVGRPYALAVPGQLLAHRFDAASRTLTARFRAAGGEGPPLLFLPAAWYPEGVEVRLDGAPVAVPVDPAVHRALVPWDGRAGEVVLTASPLP